MCSRSHLWLRGEIFNLACPRSSECKDIYRIGASHRPLDGAVGGEPARHGMRGGPHAVGHAREDVGTTGTMRVERPLTEGVSFLGEEL